MGRHPQAVTESAWEKPVCTGGPSGKPVTLTTPLRASPTLPKPGSFLADVFGTVAGDLEHHEPGFTRCSVSQSRPNGQGCSPARW